MTESTAATTLEPTAHTETFAEPSVGDVHVDGPVKVKGRTTPYLAKMYDHLKSMCGNGPITREHFAEAVRKSRGHAGGTAKAANRANLLAQMSEEARQFSWDKWNVEHHGKGSGPGGKAGIGDHVTVETQHGSVTGHISTPTGGGTGGDSDSLHLQTASGGRSGIPKSTIKSVTVNKAAHPAVAKANAGLTFGDYDEMDMLSPLADNGTAPGAPDMDTCTGACCDSCNCVDTSACACGCDAGCGGSSDDAEPDRDADDIPGLEKADKRVNYRTAVKVGEQCGLCRFYCGDGDGDEEEDHECVVVEGWIDPAMVCNIFAPRVAGGTTAVASNEDGAADVVATMGTETQAAPPVAASEAGVDIADACVVCPVAMSEDEKRVSHPGGWAIFTELPQAFVEPPEWLNYLPKPGSYKSERYGMVRVTPERNDRFVKNFKDAVYQRELPIDLEHASKLSGAVGWITDMRKNVDGSVDAQVKWNERGQQALREDRFHYFSPEFYDTWTDPMRPELGKFSDIAIGGGLTTRPFFKERALKSLVMSEGGIRVGEITEQQFRDFDSGVGGGVDRDELDASDFGDPEGKKYPIVTQSDVDDAKTLIGKAADPEKVKARIIAIAKRKGFAIPAAWKSMTEEDTMGDETNTTGTVTAAESAPGTSTAPAAGVASEPAAGSMAFAEQLASRDAEIAALKLFNEQQTQMMEDMSARTHALESVARRKRFTDMALGQGGEDDGRRWFGEVDENVAMLETLADSVENGENSAVFQQHVVRMRAMAEQAHTAGLFNEVGTDASVNTAEGDGTALGKLQVFAEQLIAEGKAESPTAALAEAAKLHPEAYAEYVKERREAR